MNFLTRLYERFIRILPTKLVINRYLAAGYHFGDAVSYSYLGESGNMERLLNRWARWEREYARRGYEPISLDIITDHARRGQTVPQDMRYIRRRKGRQPKFHAEIYRKIYLGRTPRLVDFEDSTPQAGVVQMPSTED